MPPTDPTPSNSSESPTANNYARHPCLTCQRRKVKCDRRFPCTRCLTYGHECKQPEVQREPRRPARKSQDLNSRVRQLEEALEEARALLRLRTTSNSDPQSDIFIEEANEIKSEPDSLDNLLGHLIIDEDKSRYISTSSWANFAWEASDLGTFLEETSGIRINNLSGSARLISSGLFGQQPSATSQEAPKVGLDVLWPIYVQNADPMLKILHIPSLEPIINAIIRGFNQPNEGFNCLFAAIKFAAITTLRDHECWKYGSSRQLLLGVFRREVQEALTNANFLISENLITIQAFVIFLVCSRRCEQARTMWMLVGIAMRMAQSLGLHRDGSMLKLSVFTTELRRRLWWYIRELDILVAEECGFSPTHVYRADARMPLNINDADITTTDTTAPNERSEYTELTWALIRFELCKKLHEFHSHGNRKTMGDLTGSRQDVLSQCLLLRECKEILETRYFKYCSTHVPLQRMALKLGHRVILKLSLVIQCPLFHISGHRSAEHLSSVMMDQLTAISCEIIESQHNAINDPETSGWSWILQTHIHWHPVAYLLNLIYCSERPLEQLQRAWTAVNYAFEDCLGLTEVDHREIWKPLESLVVKCRAKMQRLTLLDASGKTPSTEPQAQSPTVNSLSAPSDSVLFGTSTTTTSDNTKHSTTQQHSHLEQLTQEGDQRDENSEFLASPDYSMPFEVYQPFMTMDDFMSFNEGWWNAED